MEFYILQRILTGYGARIDPFSRETGEFFWQYNGLRGI